jgi:hypothetical protein
MKRVEVVELKTMYRLLIATSKDNVTDLRHTLSFSGMMDDVSLILNMCVLRETQLGRQLLPPALDRVLQMEIMSSPYFTVSDAKQQFIGGEACH